MFSSNTSQVSQDAVFIEDTFSTFLYQGNGSTQTITNGIDLSGKGGMVWIKDRTTAFSNYLLDTARGATNSLSSDTVDAQTTGGTLLSSFNSNGFTLSTSAGSNLSGDKYASWTFRKQPKFFDVVTYTGTGVARTLAHNLGSAPGFIIVKRTDASGAWTCFHRSLANTKFLPLNATNAAITNTAVWNSTSPTSTVFTVGTDTDVNASGGTYVAYLFAHNAGGFGLTGTDNVISCGSYTGTGSDPGPDVNLGFEPQWLLVKNASASSNWVMGDVMRGLYGYSGNDGQQLYPNLSNAEVAAFQFNITPTGFRVRGAGTTTNTSGSTYIYIAIRRGPMKVPTTGTSVFTPYEVPASPTTGAITGFVTDMGFIGQRSGADKFSWGSRLTGNNTLNSTSTAGQTANTNQIWDRMNGWWNSAINGYMTWGFRRAPGFFDEVCYTGTGSATTVAHNLAAVPELMIVKSRSAANYWPVYAAPIGNDYILSLNTTGAKDGPGAPQWNSTTPTASVFSLGASSGANASGATFVAYLFATCPGVSKVGSYTGNGSTQTINCGFTGGARFVLIKRTDSTGDWYVYDTARGMTTLTDPYLLLNSTAAESASLGSVTTVSSGFALNAGVLAAINTNGASYIFLAIS